MYRSPVDIYIDEWVYDLLEAVERSGARRVLIDSLTDLQHAAPDEARFREYMYSLLQRFSRQGVSLFMTSELADLFDVSRLSEFGVSHLSDNVVLLQYIREAAAVRRALTVLKTRASRHEPQDPRVQNHLGRDSPWRPVRLGARARAEPPVAGRAVRARAADLLLLAELHAHLPVGLLVNDAGTLEVLHANPPLPGFDGDRPPDRLLESPKDDGTARRPGARVTHPGSG